MTKMNHYPENEYPNLYNEIVKDWNHRWGKFNAINYPLATDSDDNKSKLLPKPIRKLPQ